MSCTREYVQVLYIANFDFEVTTIVYIYYMLIEQVAQKKKFSCPKKKSWLNESNIFWERKETKKNMTNFGIGSKKKGGLYNDVTFCITKEHMFKDRHVKELLFCIPNVRLR